MNKGCHCAHRERVKEMEGHGFGGLTAALAHLVPTPGPRHIDVACRLMSTLGFPTCPCEDHVPE